MKFFNRYQMNLPFNTNILLLAICFFTIKAPATFGISLIHTKFNNPELTDVARNSKALLDWHKALKEKDWDPMSPEGSWFLFNENDSIQKKKNKKKNCKRCSKNIPMPKEGPPGPPGPRGPMGPQGESGGTLSLQEIENYIKDYISDLLLENKTLNFDFLNIKKRRSPFKEEIPVVFTGQLLNKEFVPSQKAIIIKGFTLTFGPGQFKRGAIVKDGRFTLTKAGVYQVGGTIPIQRASKSDSASTNKDEKSPSVYVCVDNCIADRRIKWTSSLESRTSAVFSGHVRLRRGQTLMILLSNPTSYDIEILPGSTFSAALIGT